MPYVQRNTEPFLKAAMQNHLQLGLGPVRSIARSESCSGTFTQSLDDLVNSIQDPLVPLVRGQPLGALDVLLGGAVLKGLAQAKTMADDLGAHAGLRAQTGDGDQGGQDPPDVDGRVRGGRVGEQGAVVGVEDVDGQVGVRRGQLVVQLVLERVVDRRPQVPALLEPLLQILRRQLSRRRRRNLTEHVLWQALPERPQAVNRPWDPVERYALQPDFPHQLYGFGPRWGLRQRLCEVVQLDQRRRRVECHGCRRRDGEPRRHAHVLGLGRLRDPSVRLADVGRRAQHVGLCVRGVDECLECW